jgi:hypothetical protein
MVSARELFTLRSKQGEIMKVWTVVALLFLGGYGFAQAPAARKPCDDLKAEITKKLEAKKVTSYSLDVVDKSKEGDGKVVGSCEGGTKSIVYRKTTGPTPTPRTEGNKPQ